MGLQVHFLHRNVRDTVIILEQGNLHHPQCTRCDMLVTWADLNGRHPNTAQWAKGADQKRCRMEVDEMQSSTERAFWAHGCPLTSVSQFNYIGRVLTASVDEWTTVVGNIKKALQKWDRFSRILGREGENTRMSGISVERLTSLSILHQYRN